MAQANKTLDQSLNDLLQSAGVSPQAESVAAVKSLGAFDPCKVWHDIRDEFGVLLGILDTVGKWLPWARQLASVLRVVQGILNQLCPG